MPDIILTTFDWVPEPPRGYVRDIRVRWRKPDWPILCTARLLKTAALNILRISPLGKCRG